LARSQFLRLYRKKRLPQNPKGAQSHRALLIIEIVGGKIRVLGGGVMGKHLRSAARSSQKIEHPKGDDLTDSFTRLLAF